MSRYLALDALRGCTIAVMILANTPGSWDYVYAPLLHADWHGCTFMDLGFPMFLFIVGSAMFFSFRKNDFTCSTPLLLMVLKRGLMLFGIGLLLNSYPFNGPWQDMRLMGVFQRIAIVYVIGAVVVLTLRKNAIYALCVGILLAYWGLLVLAGGDAPFSLQDNLVRQLDIMLLGEGHLWQGKGLAFDPEGLLSSLPAVVNLLCGFEVTRYLVSVEDKKDSAINIGVFGVVSVAIGLLWSSQMPLNKSLWTSSYALYSAGYACLALSAAIYIIDIKGFHKLTKPLIEYGSNPLLMYMLSFLCVASYYNIDIGNISLYQWLFDGLREVFEPTFASLMFAVGHVVFFWWVSSVLFRRNIFIKT
ncbi:MAG: putative acyltransferase [Phenylobacterium sp.]|jgi:predicted acyltransferase